MRNKEGSDGQPEAKDSEGYSEKDYFESFYKSNVRGKPVDWMTIGPVSEAESRFHYNATENSIIRAMVGIEAFPRPEQLEGWRFFKRREALRLLDIGSGTGHWIDFFVDAFYVAEAVAVEITDGMAAHLRTKYDGKPVTVIQGDVAGDFGPQQAGAPFDFVSAIGVMFHIVDDQRWRNALSNLANLLKPDGIMLIGGDFGSETRNVQFHKVDKFESWQEYGELEADETRVNKRVRSLADWVDAATACKLEVVDLVRSDSDRRVSTPENDLLVLRHRAR